MAKLKDINTRNIRDAIRLGCQTMSRVFNADDGDTPFFGSSVRPEAWLSFSPSLSDAHVPGRHLNALLNAEHAAGIEVDESAIEKHTRATFFSYSGAVPLPLNRDRIGGERLNFSPHNVREGFHALCALARFRESDRARQVAEASVDAIFRLWDPISGWDHDHLEAKLGLNLSRSTFIVGLARAIGPLVKLYRATGLERALELVIVLKEKAIGEFFTEEGEYDRETFGAHTHSTTCVMSSLAQLADLTADGPLMDRVRAFYDNGLWKIRDELGWVIEISGDDANPDRGEVNNTGDIVETALILGRWGYTRYEEDAERILRAHLLPSQLRDVSFIQDPPNPDGEDGKRDVSRRHLGAFGFPAPYGHEPIGAESVSFNTDIVGGAVGSLCEAYRRAVRSDRAGHRVVLLFDHDTDAAAVRSPYTHSSLGVRVTDRRPLFIRLPSWVDRSQLSLEGTSEVPRYTDDHLFLARPPADRWIRVAFPIPIRTLTLRHRTREIRVRLRGDEVVGMDNFGADLTYFDSHDDSR